MGKRIRDLTLVTPADDFFLPADRADLTEAGRVAMGTVLDAYDDAALGGEMARALYATRPSGAVRSLADHADDHGWSILAFSGAASEVQLTDCAGLGRTIDLHSGRHQCRHYRGQDRANWHTAPWRRAGCENYRQWQQF